MSIIVLAEGLKSTVFGESNRIDLEEFTSLSKTTPSKSSSFHFNSPAMDAFSLNVQGKSKLGFQYHSKDGGSAGKRRGNRSSDGMMQVKEKETPRSGERSRNSEGMVTDKQYFLKQKETSLNSGERHCDRSSSQSSAPQHSRRSDKIFRNQSSGDKLLNQISNKSREKESARSYSDLSHHGRAHNSRVSGSIVNESFSTKEISRHTVVEAKSSLLKSHASIGSRSEAHAPANNSQDGDDNGFYVEKERAPSTYTTPHGSKQHSSSKRPHVNLNSNSHGGTGKKNKNKGYMELGHIIHCDSTGNAPLKKNGNGEVHIGNGVWISEDYWTQRYSILPKLSIVAERSEAIPCMRPGV
ncbi:BEN domain-containing protein 5 [Frankliniella fusca]|uniref:BEN domain-containing protein 5 n=1 Tax=Frankliniella fusca TaxID=407009 RepID=A0AAE1LJ26_9NEOP|nr:BEN domain-containing protein 5 [Frankliniella fusca]